MPLHKRTFTWSPFSAFRKQVSGFSCTSQDKRIKFAMTRVCSSDKVGLRDHGLIRSYPSLTYQDGGLNVGLGTRDVASQSKEQRAHKYPHPERLETLFWGSSGAAADLQEGWTSSGARAG